MVATTRCMFFLSIPAITCLNSENYRVQSSFPSPLTDCSSSACTPFLLSSLVRTDPYSNLDSPPSLIYTPLTQMNTKPASTNTVPLTFTSSTSSHRSSTSYRGCARISLKPLSPCRFPESTGRPRCSETTSHITLPPNKRRAGADIRAFRRMSMCPPRRWHNVGPARKTMYVICEEDEQTYTVPPTPPNTLKRRPPLKRSASESSVPITSVANSEELAERYVRFAHMVVEVRMPPIEDQPLDDEDVDSESSSQSDSISICSDSTGSDPDLDCILNNGGISQKKKVRRPVSRLSKLLRGYY
jgi:hypothetical protein